MKKYLCGVSFQFEVGECDDIHFYDSIKELKKKGKCWKQCGIVEIEFDGPGNPTDRGYIKSHKWVKEQDMNWGGKKVKPDPKAKTKSAQRNRKKPDTRP